MKKPLISIITVVYNSADLIEETLLSVINQNYDNVQYIVIDGGSKDSTLNIISKYLDKIDIFVSEPDLGIYNAMNKALTYVSGDWVNFMNAGDLFCDAETLNNVFSQSYIFNPEVAIIYGNHILMYQKKEVLRIPRNLQYLWKGMTIQHQSVFVKSEIFKELKFNEKYKFAADFDLFYNCFKRNLLIINTNFSISKVTPGGFSETNSVKTYLEFMDVALNYEKSIYVKLYYGYLVTRVFLISLIKRFL
jgi:glycosyltransferase involved in cell wall biosynthesis